LKIFFLIRQLNISHYKQLVKTALKFFLAYKSKLDFGHITTYFLNSYEANMLEKGKTINTVSIYLRTVRISLINAKEINLTQGNYPF
jgi:Phage integrase SAM-like domain